MIKIQITKTVQRFSWSVADIKTLKFGALEHSVFGFVSNFSIRISSFLV